MDNNKLIINREELYKKVWEKPVVLLAPEYNISNVGLKKICKKLKIPTPPLGYWAKHKSGYKLKKQPLPKLKKGDPETYTLTGNRTRKTDITLVNKEVCEHAKFEKLPKNIITVSQKLSRPHRLVKETREVLSNASVDDYGVLRPWRKPYLDIRVSPSSLKRALRIMDTLLKAFEKRGFSIEISINGKTPSSYVTNEEDKVQFSLREIIKQQPYEPSIAEKIEIKKNPHFHRVPKWEYIPTGRLSIKINTWSSDISRKTWNDGKINRIEDLLNNYMITIKVLFDIKRQNTLDQEERERLEHEQMLIFQEAERKREIEGKKIAELEAQAISWEKNQQLHAYIKAVESIVQQKELSENLTKKYELWLSWARNHAENLNPLKNNLPFEKNLNNT